MFNLHRGFTLLELLVSMAIVAILLSIAAPSLSQFIQNRELAQQTSLIASALSTARSTALAKAANTNVCWNASGATLNVTELGAGQTIDSGELVVVDTSETTADAMTVSRVSFLSTGYNFINDFTDAAANTAQCVTFDSQGRSTSPGDFVICSAQGAEADSITIRLNVNGRSSEIQGNQIAGTNCV